MLFSYDVHGRSKVAVVVVDDRDPSTYTDGWVQTAWQAATPSEFAPSADADLPIEIWTNQTGRRMPTDVVVSYHGSDCGWTDVTFLDPPPNSISETRILTLHTTVAQIDLRPERDPAARRARYRIPAQRPRRMAGRRWVERLRGLPRARRAMARRRRTDPLRVAIAHDDAHSAQGKTTPG